MGSRQAAAGRTCLRRTMNRIGLMFGANGSPPDTTGVKTFTAPRATPTFKPDEKKTPSRPAIRHISFGTKTTRQPNLCRRTHRERHMRRTEQSVALLAEGFLASVFARLDQIQFALNLDRHNYGFIIQRPEIRIRRCQH